MIDKDSFKLLMRQHAASVVVITVKAGECVHGMTATSFTAVSADPPLILFCVNRANSTHRLLEIGASVGISLLSEFQEEFSQRFACKTEERYSLADLRFEHSPDRAPLIPDACAALEAVIREQHWGGDHSIFVAEIAWASIHEGRAPLVYHSGAYARLHRVPDHRMTVAD